MVFAIADGFLTMARGEDDDDPSLLTEPDEQGVLSIVGASYVTFTPQVNEAGEVEAIQIHVGGEPRLRLVRESE